MLTVVRAPTNDLLVFTNQDSIVQQRHSRQSWKKNLNLIENQIKSWIWRIMTPLVTIALWAHSEYLSMKNTAEIPECRPHLSVGVVQFVPSVCHFEA